ncbi:MAG: hypothetical protein EBS06_06870 [Proteobacteria bacterium]|nr:hypothetical protein [Pseudomonadota bacterium]
MTNYIFKNQRLIDKKQAQVSIQERGLLFGDGIFETCRIVNGKIFNFSAHQARINKGLQNLKFFADVSDLEKKSLKLIAKNKIKNGLLRILISRGIGSLGYLPTYKSEPLTLIETLPARKLPKKIRLGISNQITPVKNLGKTLSALPYVLAKIEAQEKNLFDCVLLSSKKFIAETASANIFWVKNNKVFTSAKSCGILAGTARELILKLSKIKIIETEKKISALKNADEIFLTNATFLVISVDEFLGRKLEKKFATQFLKILKAQQQ